MNFGVDATFGFSAAGSGGGGGGSTTQFMWVVGGPSNFGGAPAAGATTLVNAALVGVKVRMSRNGLWQMGLNPLTGNTYYTKILANDFVTFSAALANGEELIVETIPN